MKYNMIIGQNVKNTAVNTVQFLSRSCVITITNNMIIDVNERKSRRDVKSFWLFLDFKQNEKFDHRASKSEFQKREQI